MPQKTEIIKLIVRPFLPITSELVYLGAKDGLENYLGVGFSNTIAKFDGQKTEIFRLKKDFLKIKKASLEFGRTKKFLRGVNSCKRKVKKYRKLLQENQSLEKILPYFLELYAILIVSYCITNYWSDKVVPSLNLKNKILRRGEEYRRITEGIINELEDYLKGELKKKKLSFFTTLSDFRQGKKTKENLEEGFILSRGKFFHGGWERFLKNSGYFYKEEKIVDTKEIKGIAAGGGKVRGRIKVIFNPNDFRKFRAKDILVTPMTQVNFLPVIRKASAIITDEGGITSHAAIVSRELGIPCVISTRIATKVFKDGQLVEVDATAGIVKIIK